MTSIRNEQVAELIRLSDRLKSLEQDLLRTNHPRVKHQKIRQINRCTRKANTLVHEMVVNIFDAHLRQTIPT